MVPIDNFLNLETLAIVGETALKFLVFSVSVGVGCMVEYWDRECTTVLRGREGEGRCYST